MKTFRRILGSLLIAGVALSVPSRSGADSLGAMRVGIVEGDVQVKIAETGEWAPASVNMPLVEGDELWVPYDSRSALQTSDGAHVRLDGGTALEVLRMDRDSFQLYLAQGYAYVLSPAPPRSLLQLDTPDASVRAFGSSTFRVDILDGETDVTVFKGSVLAEGDAGATRVRAGDMLALGPGGYAELSPLPPPDDWERWNTRQDRIVLARGKSHRYLPAGLRVYAGDFDHNGRWVYVRGYGYCWTPTVLVIGNWAPYRHGKWVWRGGHYVWIGYEPWGWAPYHYGRWTFVRRVGWCWVPPARGEVFWGPGYVGWVQTPEYVAWVPLAPREIYYGYGSYGRYSVDITNVNVETIRVTNVYRNVNVVNSITLVHHTTFVTGRPAPVERRAAADIREHFAQRRHLAPGRPRIKPVESSHVPVVRRVPEAKRPPAAVRAIDARKLRQSRPLVREPDRSTLRPERRSRSLTVRKIEKPRPARERIQDPGRDRPEDSDDRGGGPERRPKRKFERNGPPASPAERKGPESRAVPERRSDRERQPDEGERQPEATGERQRTGGPNGARERTKERGLPSSPRPDDRARPERPRERPPDQSAERGGKGRAGVRQAPGPDKKEGAKPQAGDSEGEDENGKPERPAGREERRNIR